jgi:hypothetical protein
MSLIKNSLVHGLINNQTEHSIIGLGGSGIQSLGETEVEFVLGEVKLGCSFLVVPDHLMK